jgi:hypothetical protein
MYEEGMVMNRNTLTAILLLLGPFGLSATSIAQSGEPERSILPIAEPPRPHYTELDVRNATPPPRFEVKAPEGAPNVLVVMMLLHSLHHTLPPLIHVLNNPTPNLPSIWQLRITDTVHSVPPVRDAPSPNLYCALYGYQLI